MVDIPEAVHRYAAALEAWQAQLGEGSPHPDAALAVLKARDALQLALQPGVRPGVYTLQRLQQLDQQLRQQGAAMAEVLDFDAYRQSLSPPADFWWWYPAPAPAVHPQNHLDWLFKGSRVLLWTVSLGLLGDIIRRFFLGGPGVAGVSAIAFSSLLTLLNARSELTAAGQAGFDQLLENLGLPTHWHEEAKLGATGLLSLFLLGFWLSLPTVSRGYNRLGTQAASQGRLGSAEQYYQRAVALNPDNGDAHYNLGTLYEDLQQLEAAQTQYRIAVQGDVPQAYNNLGRLYLLPDHGDPAAAVMLLSRGLELAAQQGEALRADASFFNLQYNLYKNLGWARLQQQRYEEAALPLQAAIGVSQRPEAAAEIANPASAHCLLAQVLEQQGDAAAALGSWASCYRLGNSINPDEDTWGFQACQRLKEAQQPCSKD